MTFLEAIAADWLSIAAVLVALAALFVCGFLAGRLWERGRHVRRVMTGQEPPPWDQPGGDLTIPDEVYERILAAVYARAPLYDGSFDFEEPR